MPLMIEAILALLPAVRAGSVRAVAVTGAKRSKLAPEIPTMAEVGLPELNFGAWWGMWGPPNMPADLTRTINGLVNDAVKELGAEGRLDALGIEPAQETPQAFGQFLAADLERSAEAAEGRELPAGVIRIIFVSVLLGLLMRDRGAARDAGAISIQLSARWMSATSASPGASAPPRRPGRAAARLRPRIRRPCPGASLRRSAFNRSATAGSAATARTSAAMRSFNAAGMSRQP